MREDLKKRAEELARQARCTSCTALVLDSVELAQVTFVTTQVLASGESAVFQLCGSCALAVRRLLDPVVTL